MNTAIAIKDFADVKCDIIRAIAVDKSMPVLKARDYGTYDQNECFRGNPVLPNNEDFIGLESSDLSITIPSMSFWCNDYERELTIEGEIEIWDFEGGYQYEFSAEEKEQLKRLLEYGLSTDY